MHRTNINIIVLLHNALKHPEPEVWDVVLH